MKLQYIHQSIRHFCKAVAHEFLDRGCPDRAAALAFASLLSLVPLMVVSLSILSAFPVFHNTADLIKTMVFKVFVTHSAHIVENEINRFINQASKLPLPEFVFLITTALIMIFNMEITFNRIWHVPQRRHGISAFLLYWAVLTLTPLLLGTAFALGSYILSLPYIAGTVKILGLVKIGLIITPTLLTFLAFSLLYVALPNCKVPYRDAAIGALAATALFSVAKQGITVYFLYFPTYQLLYGALATIPILFIWVYLVWIIILLGAVISYILSKQRQKTVANR